MAFSDVLDLAEAAFSPKKIQSIAAKCNMFTVVNEKTYTYPLVYMGKVFSHIRENHITLRSRVLRNICSCMYAFVRSTDRYYLKISFCLL